MVFTLDFRYLYDSKAIIKFFKQELQIGVAVQSVQKVPVTRVNKINNLACV